MAESSFYVPAEYAPQLEKALRRPMDRHMTLMRSYLKMFGKTEEDLEKDPELAGKISGMIQAENERTRKTYREAERKAMGINTMGKQGWGR